MSDSRKSPTGRATSAPVVANIDFETRSSAGFHLTETLREAALGAVKLGEGEGFRVVYLDENGEIKEMRDIDMGSIDFGAVEERALAYSILVSDEGSGKSNKQLETYASGFTLHDHVERVSELKMMEKQAVESGEFNNRKGRRAREARYRKQRYVR